MLNLKKKNNIRILNIHEIKLYQYEKLEQELYDEFMTDELLLNTPGSTLDNAIEIT